MKNILELIGNTPLIKVGNVYAKLETLNPTGSIKDRMAIHILEDAEKNGLIKKGQTIVEATSGNTGISLSFLAAVKGYKMIAVMPKNMSMERIKMIKSFGAEVQFVGENDFAGAVEKRDKIADSIGGFIPDQFANPVNVAAHFENTGKEILEQLDISISAFVAGVGTGGTLIGTARRIKTKYPNCKTVAVEPLESAVMSGKEVGKHEIQGIGDGFIPPIVKMGEVDEVIAISDKDAKKEMKRLCIEHGLMVGISSGANVLAAERAHKKYGGAVVTVLPDRMERYLSMLE